MAAPLLGTFEPRWMYSLAVAVRRDIHGGHPRKDSSSCPENATDRNNPAKIPFSLAKSWASGPRSKVVSSSRSHECFFLFLDPSKKLDKMLL